MFGNYKCIDQLKKKIEIIKKSVMVGWKQI